MSTTEMTEKVDEIPTNGTSSSEETDNDQGQWMERENNPMFNVLVLETLFKYVRPNDLKACRLTCKKWNEASLPAARSSFEVTIFGNPASKNTDGTLDRDTRRMCDFMALFGSKPLDLPFTKFILGSINPTVGAAKEFFQLFGHMVKKIDLYQTHENHSVEDVAELLRLIPMLESFKMPYSFILKKESSKLFSDTTGIPELKYLKTLNMGESIVADRRETVCPTFFEEFLSAAENVSAFLTSETRVDDSIALELLNILAKLGRGSKIETLSIPHMKKEHVAVLEEMPGLKLKHLSVKIGQLEMEREQTWMELVEMMSDSLISVQVQNNDFIPHFPRMPKLELLDLGTYLDSTRDHQFPLNNFDYTFPALKYLRLSSTAVLSMHAIRLNLLFRESECCPRMEALCLGNCIGNLQTFNRVLETFPNLKELELKITFDGADVLQRIWTQMTRLEKLYISGLLTAENIETLITGFSTEEMKKMRETKWYTLKYMTKEVRRQEILDLIQQHRSLPSIGNLTNLRHLTMNLRIGVDYGLQQLSDLTGYFGFYSMGNLRNLNVSDCNFSKSCSQILVSDMELESWDFTPSRIIASQRNLKWSNDEAGWDFPNSKVSK